MAGKCRDAVREVFENENGVLQTREVVERIYARYPSRPWKPTAIYANLVGLTVNLQSSKYHPRLRRAGFLFSPSRGQFRRWDPERDGNWGVVDGQVQPLSGFGHVNGIPPIMTETTSASEWQSLVSDMPSEAASLAKAVGDWISPRVTGLFFGRGHFEPVLELKGPIESLRKAIPFRIRRDGIVDLNLNYLASTRAFAEPSKREELIRRIRQGGVPIPEYSISGRPEFPLGVLGRPEALIAFQGAIDWVLEELKGMENDEDSAIGTSEVDPASTTSMGSPSALSGGRSTDPYIEGGEDETDEAPLEIPSDRRSVKTEKSDVPVETLHAWMVRGKLNLQPEFQRMFVWNRSTASKLIESLLLSIPIPVVYLAEEDGKKYSVVDGQQRLTSIKAYLEGRFPDGRDFRLSGLQILADLKGKLFRELPENQQEAITGAVLRVISITKDSDPDVKFEVFERLNLGSVKLNDQELRNCMFRGSYNNLLSELSLNKPFRRIFGTPEPDTRMRDRQLVLRFFAMWRKTHLKYRGPMKAFLNHEMEENRNLDGRQLAEMREAFERSIDLAFTVFGPKAFRRFSLGRPGSPNGSWERKLNVALWDTLLYTFSFYEKRQVVPIADRVREEFLDVVTTDPTFAAYVSSTTDKPDRVQYRATVWKRRLDDLVGEDLQGPRGFTSELKERLLRSNPTCEICGQRILDQDDAEIDHIEHYWRGGKTIPENARLAHRYCNRARGGRE